MRKEANQEIKITCIEIEQNEMLSKITRHRSSLDTRITGLIIIIIRKKKKKKKGQVFYARQRWTCSFDQLDF